MRWSRPELACPLSQTHFGESFNDETVRFSSPILGPDALRIAADAFEAALQSFHEGVCEIEPHKARQLLAQHIIVEAQRGQRDPQRLRDAALKHLETIVRVG